MPLIPLDQAHRALVVIPTVAHPATLVPTVARIARDAEAAARAGGLPTALVLSVNAPDPAAADEAVAACVGIAGDTRGALDLLVERVDRPIGFGAANNRGVMAAVAHWGGVPELTVFHNDDAHPAAGWLDQLIAALNTEVVHGYSEPWDPNDPNSRRPDRPAAAYGRVGLVGPISNLVAGIQQAYAVMTPAGMMKWGGDVEPFAAACAQRYGGQRVTADFLSGFCVGLRRAAMSDLLLCLDRDGVVPYRVEEEDALLDPAFHASGTTGDAQVEVAARGPILLGPWDEVQYPIAGFEDNDLCVRAELAGWRCVVAADTFVGHVGHQTFDRLFPDALRGMRNRQAFYDRWASITDPDRELRLVMAIRLRFEVGNDVGMCRQMLARMSGLVDGVAVVLTANPLEVREDVSWQNDEGQLHPDDVAMLQACSGQGPEGVAEVVRAWAAGICENAQDSRVAAEDVRVECWTQAFNERDERTRSHEVAAELGADWVLSIDHDEVLEDRVRRWHLERLMRHPDPLVRSYDQGWLNHWDHPRLIREDTPWGDGGKYIGGMHGFRLWRLPRREDGTLAPTRRILAGTANGLHCGNSPDHDVTAKRASGLRFRHFGYLRLHDRGRKRARYRVQDPDATADRALTGSRTADPYGHLIAEEGMRLTPYSRQNGIGLHVLVHAGETVEDLARTLDYYYGVVDRIVLVWTGAWSQVSQDALLDPPDPRVAEAVVELAERRAAWLQGGREAGVPEPIRLRAARASRVAPNAVRDVAEWDADGPSREFFAMAARFGCEWVHQPLEDDLAAARNAGLEGLMSRREGLGWSLFCDLDEHLSNPFSDGVAIRRQAECTDAFGWLWVFRNHHRGVAPSRSESIRMARLLPEVRLAGRVHETYDKALSAAQIRGVDVVIRQVSFTVEHVGLARDDDAMAAKLRRYQRMLLLELQDDPHNSQAWVALALHELNDGREDTGRECLERAVLCAGPAYLAYRELAMWHLRRGTALLGGALQRTSRGHDFYRALGPLHETLAKAVPALPILGSAQRGVPVTPPVELPPFTPPPDAGAQYRVR